MVLPFLILALRVAALPVVSQLVSPVGGEVWTAGEVRTVSWVPRGGTVTVQYSKDGLVERLTVVDDAPDTGSVSWEVPNIPSNRARMFVRYSGDAEEEYSDPFSVRHIPTGQSTGSLVVSGSASERVERIDIDPLVAFPLFLVTDVDFEAVPFLSGIKSWEAGVQVPAGITVTDVVYLTSGPIDIGIGPTNFVVGTGECVTAASMPKALVRLDCLLLAPASDLEVRIGPASPSSLDPADAPAWAGCGSAGGIWPYPDTAGVTVNPIIPATGASSWGAVKAGFGP